MRLIFVSRAPLPTFGSIMIWCSCTYESWDSLITQVLLTLSYGCDLILIVMMVHILRGTIRKIVATVMFRKVSPLFPLDLARYCARKQCVIKLLRKDRFDYACYFIIPFYRFEYSFELR